MFTSLCFVSLNFVSSASLLAQEISLKNLGEIDDKSKQLKEAQEKERKRLEKLIQDLGHKQFVVREAAESELHRAGILAFDLLQQSKHHENVEIALRSRYLLKNMTVQWIKPYDPVFLKELLSNCKEQSVDNRLARLDRIRETSPEIAIEAFCRVLRFDESELVSKEAALLILDYPFKDFSQEDRKKIAFLIENRIGISGRVAANWARLYADGLLSNKPDFASWEKALSAEQNAYALSHEETNRPLMRRLFRWYANYLVDHNQQNRSLVYVRQSLQYTDSTTEELMITMDWLASMKSWEGYNLLYENFSGKFHREPLLLYKLAEATNLQNDQEKTKQFADIAFSLSEDSIDQRLSLAVLLNEWGLFSWAQRELEAVIHDESSELYLVVRSHVLSSQIYYEHQQYQKGADSLVTVFEKLKQESETSYGKVEIALLDQKHLKGQMYYYQALVAKEEKREADQKNLLELAWKSDPRNPDYLIEQFQSYHDHEKSKVKERIQSMLATNEKKAAEASKQLEQLVRINAFRTEIIEARQEYAFACNQSAWLIANTEGDLDLALDKAKVAVAQSQPENRANYLDTLAAVYAARKEYPLAITQIEKALQLVPHHPVFMRRLGQYRELATQKNEG
ncbi:MAG: hypothetical protein MPJ24_04685 [Pirellulaceae bacterium]|nr:hypothetical protein [Pirellulaceae bacterium]